jgi:DNA-binding HxlR family transcriptional regulator
MENKMGKALGQRQLEIAELLRKRSPLTADELSRVIYKGNLTKTLQNVMWRSLNGLERRRMIQAVGKSISGGGRWELTKQGRKDIEALKDTKNVSTFPSPR